MMTNPLIQDWDTPFELAPFDKISDDDFEPALEEALTTHRMEIDAIASCDVAPTFANTIEALEEAGSQLDRVLGVFFTVAGADSNPAREDLQRKFSPQLAAHFSDISSNKALSARVAEVWEKRDSFDLTDEQARVLMLTHRGFVRSGAALESVDDTRMKEIKGRLAVLGTQFTQNLLADERSWFMKLEEADLEGLPGIQLRGRCAEVVAGGNGLIARSADRAGEVA
jgi:peptidyl-dipeptidase Dcp